MKKILFLSLVFGLALIFGFCKPESNNQTTNGADIKSNTLPTSIHGNYCEEGAAGMDCPALSITATEVFDTSMGGCTKIKDFTNDGNTYNINCEEGDTGNVTIKVLSADKIIFTSGSTSATKERQKK
ncbi:MAG: hypothetical protein IPL26_16075 [Leptospiraceae bacterium]|nr:hypothetical protein [Leptospiraceae bacterium]